MIIAPIIRILIKLFQHHQAQKAGNTLTSDTSQHAPGASAQQPVQAMAASSVLGTSDRRSARSRDRGRDQRRQARRESRPWR